MIESSASRSLVSPSCRLLRPANPTGLLINSLLVISQLARSTHAHYDALAGALGCRIERT